MKRNLKKVTENTEKREVFKVMHYKVEIINNFKKNSNKEAEIIFYKQKIYVILLRKLNIEEFKWLNFYILIYSNQNYGKNTFFQFKLTKKNKLFHTKVLKIIGKKKFYSSHIISLIKKVGEKNEKC